MFRGRCAYNSNNHFKGIRLYPALQCRLIIFFTVAILCGPHAISAEPKAERNAPDLADASSPELAAAILQELAANFPELGRPTTSVVINISLNREIKGDYFVERDGDGDLFIKVEDLLALKLRFPRDRVLLINGEKYVSLRAVRDVTYTVDEKKLTVSIHGKTTESNKTAIELYPLQARPLNLYYPRETSAFFNYGLTYSYAEPAESRSYSFSNRIGARTGDVFFVSDSLYTKTEANQQFVRLQSSAAYERRNDLQWLVAGDQFANSGDLGSSVNMGGIGFSKLYRLDPYFISQPVFDFKGVAQFPSEADIYLDGVLIGKQPIAPGQFDLTNIYSYAGSHKLDIVLKDPFGNEQKVSYPLYFGAQLLREGLHEYSYNAGFLREKYGTESNDYGKPVFSAFHRYGVTSAFNIGARAEGSDGVANGGISTAFTFSPVGVFVMSTARSRASGVKGSAVSFQHAYQQGSFSTNLLYRGFSRDYATVSAPTPSTMTKYAASLGVGFQLGALGGISFGYSSSKTYDGVTTRVTSGNYSRQLSKTVGLFVTASTARTDNTINAVYLGLNYTPANNVHGSTSYSRTGDTNTETLQIQKDTPVGEGVGYHVSANRTENASSSSYGFNPGVQYNARYGIYTLDAIVQNTNPGQTAETYNLSASGSLVYAGGFFAASRPVNDSFSIVMVDSLPDAVVLNNGQEIGTTNSSGAMVAPNLVSYGQNQITLDVKNLPIDYTVSGVNQMISPPVWSGSCISFDALKVRALTGTLFLRDGDKKKPLEYVDIVMKVGDREVTYPTGKGGEFYLENKLPEDTKGVTDRQSCRAIAERRKSGGNVIVPGTYRATVEYEGGVCGFSIIFPKTDEPIIDIGEVMCIIKKPT